MSGLSVEAAASAALAMLQMRYPTLIAATDKALTGAYKVGFAAGARYIWRCACGGQMKLFMVVTEPKMKYRHALNIGIEIVEAETPAQARKKAEMFSGQDWKRPYAVEIKAGSKLTV